MIENNRNKEQNFYRKPNTGLEKMVFNLKKEH